MYLEPGLCLWKLSNIAEYFVSRTTCTIWIGCETAIWAVTSYAWPRTEGSVVDTHVLAADEPPRLTYTSVLNIYLYIQHKWHLKDWPMNDNLRMLHCVVCLARIQAGADRHHSTWSHLSWSDLQYYHMAWMAVPSKLFLNFFFLLYF